MDILIVLIVKIKENVPDEVMSLFWRMPLTYNLPFLLRSLYSDGRLHLPNP